MGDYLMEPLKNNVEEMFIGPFGSSLKNDCFVDEEKAFCMVYEQKHAIQKTMNVETRYVDEKKYSELSRFNVRGGDIIVSCRGTIGETFIVPDNAPLGIMHPSIMKIRLKEGVYNKDYFNALLIARLKKHESEANGSGIKMAISAKALGEELFPVPPIKTQEKIAEILATIKDTIGRRNREIELLDELIKARFVELFGDLKINDKEWDVLDFSDIARIDTNMIHDFSGYQDYPHIGIDSIEKETGRLEGYRTVSEDGVISGKYLFTPEHIIYSKIRPNLNKVAMPEFAGVCSADAYPILVNKDKCNREYLTYVLRGNAFLDYILAFSNRTNLPKVNKQQVEGFKCPVPPVSLQEDFKAFVKQVNKSKVV